MKLYRLEVHDRHDWTVQYFRRLEVAKRFFAAACAASPDESIYLDMQEIDTAPLGIASALNVAAASRYQVDGLRPIAENAGSF